MRELDEFDYLETADGLVYAFSVGDERIVFRYAGYGSPEVEYITQRAVYAQREEVKAFKVKPRIIEFDHREEGCDRCDYWNKAYTLADLLRPDRLNNAASSSAKLVKRMSTGKEYYLKVYITKGIPMSFGASDFWDEYSIDAPISFVSFDPFVYSRTTTEITLVDQGFIPNVAKVIRFDGCEWDTVDGGVTAGGADYVIGLKITKSGRIYMGGVFTEFGGTTAANVAEYEDGAWLAMGTGVSGGYAKCFVEAGDGSIYVGGTFTSAGGVANTKGIAKWDPVGKSWSAVGSGITTGTAVRSIAIDTDGLSFVMVGAFTNVSGTVTANVAHWNALTSTWSDMGLPTFGFPASTTAVVIQKDGTVVVAGQFADVDAIVGTVNIAKYKDSAWDRIGYGLGSTAAAHGINDLVLAQDGSIYAGGGFLASDTAWTPSDRIARWGGQSWLPVGSGVNGTIQALALDNSGKIYMAGSFTIAGEVRSSGGIALWDGTRFQPVVADTVGSMYDIDAYQGNMIVAGSFSGDLDVSGCTAVFSKANAQARPILSLAGPRIIHQIGNIDQGVYVNFNALELLENEVLTIDISGELHADAYGNQVESATVVSNYRGDLIHKVSPGSRLSELRLLPGLNRFTFVAEDGSFTAASVLSHSIEWRDRFWSMATCGLECNEVDASFDWESVGVGGSKTEITITDTSTYEAGAQFNQMVITYTYGSADATRLQWTTTESIFTFTVLLDVNATISIVVLSSGGCSDTATASTVTTTFDTSGSGT